MKAKIRSADYFETNSGITENLTTYTSDGIGFNVAGGTYTINSVSQFINNGYTLDARFADIANFKFRIAVGCDVNGAGYAFDFIGDVNGIVVQYNTIDTWTGAATATLETAQISGRGFQYNSNTWYSIRLYFANGMLKCEFANRTAIDITSFGPVNFNWGVSGIDSATTTIISSLNYFENQIFYGNVNINGIHQGAEGRAVMFDQDFVSLYKYDKCNADGNYMIFVTTDESDFKRYFLIGFVNNVSNVQPRGVSNLMV